MPSSTVISLAILKANWDLLRKDYLENFVPIIAESIRLSKTDFVSLPDLQNDLRTRFGLRLPQNAIKSILRRVRKRGYIQLQHGTYLKKPKRLAQLNFQTVQREVIRKQEALISRLLAFCSEKFDISWELDEAENALLSYLEENQTIVLSATSYGTVIPPQGHTSRSAKYVVGAFVRHLQETDDACFEYLETVVVGNMLANAIFLTEPGRTQKKFHNTMVYFDTTFLISALGYEGEFRQAPCTELLELLYTAGANLLCFKHTVDEIRGILNAGATIAAYGRTRDVHGRAIEHFLARGYTPSDIELLSATLERDLRSLRISVTGKPSYVHKYVIDEQALSDLLDSQMAYRNPLALQRDVDSVSAVMRLREGGEFYEIEDCRALFVTTNVDLVCLSRDFFHGEHPYGEVPPCTTDYTLANLLWLKTPVQAPDLPRKRIIADYYAAMQPDERLWRRYLDEIDKLEQSGAVTAEDYYLLRHSLEAKFALMDLTLGEEEAFTEGTVPEIIEVTKSRIRAGLEAELAEERTLRASAEKSAAQVQVKEQQRIADIRARAERYAATAAKILEYGTVIIVLLAVCRRNRCKCRQSCQ